MFREDFDSLYELKPLYLRRSAKRSSGSASVTGEGRLMAARSAYPEPG